MSEKNASAADLWRQMFERMADEENAAIVDPQHDDAADEARFREAMAKAGWSEPEIQQRIDAHHERVRAAPQTSPGVSPHVEFQHAQLCDDVEGAMSRLGMESHGRVARGIEPRLGPIAAKINVVLTDESIVAVGAFLFRFCGLVARAFARTLYLNPWLWEDANYTEAAGRKLLMEHPRLLRYWLQIFQSYALTGTNVIAAHWPSNRMEVILTEQVARGMEIFAIAHEYGHHHLNHGRSLEGDPKSEEFDADRFALVIGYEVGRKPVIAPNPYLSYGAGGVVLLLALTILHEFEDDFRARTAEPAGTHPEASERIANLESATGDIGEEFAGFKHFRVVAGRVMTCVGAILSEFRAAIPPEDRAKMRELLQGRS